MKIGFYMADSRYGQYLADVESYTSFTFCEAETKGDYWYHKTKRQFIKALQRAKDHGLKIHLNLQDTDPAKVVKLAAPVWDAVELIDVCDEPKLKLRAMTERLVAIDDAIFAAGLRSKPIGAVFTASALRTLNGWRSAYLDWRGIEGYISPTFQHSKAAAVSEVKRVLREQLDIIDDAKPIVVVGHANDSHGKWTNISTLVAVQHATYAVAAADKRVTHIRFFNWGREDGTRNHPELIAAHRAIAKKAGRA